MIVRFKLIPQGKRFQNIKIDADATGQDLLEKLDLAYDAHIITRKGDPIPLDEKLRDGDSIGIIRVVSGG